MPTSFGIGLLRQPRDGRGLSSDEPAAFTAQKGCPSRSPGKGNAKHRHLLTRSKEGPRPKVRTTTDTTRHPVGVGVGAAQRWWAAGSPYGGASSHGSIVSMSVQTAYCRLRPRVR